jgi:NTE family protein
MNGARWVFGGGGVGALARKTGMLAGLLDEGVAVGSADRLLGTSAGAVDAALVRTSTQR